MDIRQAELREAREWVKSNVVFEYSKENNVLEVHAATIFPVKENSVFEILSHPMGEEVYRGISGCVKRKILENDGEGNMLLEVHNKSEWNVLGLVRGSVVSKLLVETSLQRNLMHFGLLPGSSQMLHDMYGIWRCYSLCGDALRDFLEMDGERPRVCDASKLSQGSLVTLYQRFEFSTNIPIVLHGAVARAAVGQIRSSFEDLIIAVWRLQQGFSSLPPLMTVIMKEIDLEEEGEEYDEEGGGEPPPSVDSTSAKSILDEKAYSYIGKNTQVNDRISNKLREELEAYYEERAGAAELMADAKDGLVSHPLTRMESLELTTRVNNIHSLRSIGSIASLASLELHGHRVDSIKSLTSLVEVEAKALELQRAAEGGGTDAEPGSPPARRGFFRRVKSLVDGYMGVDVEDSFFDEDDEYMLGEGNWMVVA